MGDLLIRNVPEDLKRDLGEIARNTGRSMSDAAKDMIRTGVERYQSIPASAGKNAYEQLREQAPLALVAPPDDFAVLSSLAEISHVTPPPFESGNEKASTPG